MDVRETLAAVRATYPTDRGLTREERAALLNAVAWAHRDEGVGLEKKPGGDNVPQPRTGILIAQDILRFPGNIGRDVLKDAEGAAEPAWGDPGPADPATFVAPVEPIGASQPPVDPPPVDPPPVPPNIEARLTALEARVLAIEQRQQPVPPLGPPPTVPPAAGGAATEATLRELVDLVKGALSAFGR